MYFTVCELEEGMVNHLTEKRWMDPYCQFRNVFCERSLCFPRPHTFLVQSYWIISVILREWIYIPYYCTNIRWKFSRNFHGFQAFLKLTSLFPILLSSPTLSNDTSRLMFNVISHEYHIPICNRKPFTIYNILHFTYPHQNMYIHTE
jgi:hypothetical protein